MYWYPLDKDEEDRAWEQAEAQSEEVDGEPWDGAAKFIGNLGEIVVSEFFDSFAPEEAWEHNNADALEYGTAEFSDVDFTVRKRTIDVKTTSDIRKFSPMYTYDGDEFEFAFGEAESGFPSIDPDSEADIYIFVLVSTPERESPIPSDTSETDNWVSTYEHTGNYMALILGWMFAHSIQGEAIGNLTDRSGKFTRLHTRDMYELFMRTGVNPEF